MAYIFQKKTLNKSQSSTNDKGKAKYKNIRRPGTNFCDPGHLENGNCVPFFLSSSGMLRRVTSQKTKELR